MPTPDSRPPVSRLFLLPSLALAGLLLGGCAQQPPKPVIQEVRVEVPVEVVLPADAAARQLLAYHARLLQMNATELAQALRPNRADEDASLPPGEALQLALALSLNRGPGDNPRARALLDQVLHSDTAEAAAWQGLARLLAGPLAEQHRLEEQLDKLGQQAREQQRESQRKLDQLNEKLDALKAIERSLIDSRPANPGKQP